MAGWPTIGELEAYRQQEIPTTSDEAAELALAVARSAVQAYTRQRIELVTDDVVELHGHHERDLTLPERPVVEVSAVSVGELELAAAGFKVLRDKLRRLDGGTWAADEWTTPGIVTVTYTHGYADIPTDIRSVVLSFAARLFGNPEALTGYRIGTYSVTYGGPSSSPGLTSWEERILRRYRRRIGNVVVGSGR